MRGGIALILLIGLGCSRPPTAVSPTGGGSGPKLEVSADLAQEGIAVSEKRRGGGKLLLVIASPDKDHETTNYAYTLYGTDGGKLQTNSFTILSFAKGGSSEYEIDNDDLPKASRLVVHFLGK